MSLRYLSVCSGIEAASVAWNPLGFEAVAFSEIEPFPCAVLTHHYPSVPNYGDLTRFREWPDAAFDVLVGGTPCQSFSVAGLRAGLVDPRGNLALTYLAVAERYRPKWVVWENVPGVLSSTSHDAPDPCLPPDHLEEGAEWVGEDEYDADESHAFACFLAGLSELGYRWAYGSLDAQYFDLAQRRLRVFVVGHLGDWRRAAAVLFERASLSGHPAPRREAGQRLAADSARSVAIRGRDGTPQAELGDDKANAILTPNGGRGGIGCGAVIAPTIPSRSTAGGGLGTDFDCDGGLITGALTCRGSNSSNAALDEGRLLAFGGNNSSGPIDIATACQAHGGPHGRMDFGSETFIAHSLRADGFDASEDGTGRGTPLVPIQCNGTNVGMGLPSLRRGDGGLTSGVPAVAFDWQRGGDSRGLDPKDTAQLQRCQVPALHSGMQVRRLTPRECERLQGFPDDYTLIPYRGKPAADGPRYKALGNSMAVPVMAWIGKRIAMVEAL